MPTPKTWDMKQRPGHRDGRPTTFTLLMFPIIINSLSTFVTLIVATTGACWQGSDLGEVCLAITAIV